MSIQAVVGGRKRFKANLANGLTVTLFQRVIGHTHVLRTTPDLLFNFNVTVNGRKKAQKSQKEQDGV